MSEVDSILAAVTELPDVTTVERKDAPKTYAVGVYGFADVGVLDKIEQVSGWSVERFDGALGSDVQVICTDRSDESTPDWSSNRR